MSGGLESERLTFPRALAVLVMKIEFEILNHVQYYVSQSRKGECTKTSFLLKEIA